MVDYVLGDGQVKAVNTIHDNSDGKTGLFLIEGRRR